MQNFSLTHLSDSTLLRVLAEDLGCERGCTARVLADLAEVDARRLYLPAGYSSMFEYCVQHLRFSREKAYKRIRAARAARRFPVIFDRVAGDRLGVSAVVALAAHLTQDNATELIDAASSRTTDELEQMLAARFPRPDLPVRIEALSPAPVSSCAADQLSARTVAGATPGFGGAVPVPGSPELSVRTVAEPIPNPADAAPERIEPPAPERRPRVTPLAPERFGIQCTVSKRTHDHLRRAQELLRHQVPSGDIADVLDRALELLVRELEKRRCAATERPRASKRPGADMNPRSIPAAVRRAVWERDRGQCTFVAVNGRRCDARGHLELDHEIPVARGGAATTGNLRLRCRAHNQYEAERTYGAEFMEHKRAASREPTTPRRV